MLATLPHAAITVHSVELSTEGIAVECAVEGGTAGHCGGEEVLGDGEVPGGRGRGGGGGFWASDIDGWFLLGGGFGFDLF